MKYRTSYEQPALGLIGLFTFLWATFLGAEPIKEVRSQSGATFDAEVVAENLETAWALAFAPDDGRLFITERTGRVRIVQDGTLLEAPWVTVGSVSPPGSEAGLMGIAIDPNFAESGYVFLCYTFQRGPEQLGNRIVRFREQEWKGTDETVILDDLPGGKYHDGCKLDFGPDGKLYATTGDAYMEELPQDLASLGGKVLRMNADGSVPEDNPYTGSQVWSYGHRNAQGIAWHPVTGRLYITEHGTGGINEINIIERGQNYGWPIVRDATSDPRFTDPILIHDVPAAGVTFVTSDRYEQLKGNLVMAVLGTGMLYRVVLNAPDYTTVVQEDRLLVEQFGRLRDVIEGPDGYLYISTSNRDGRGQPVENDDRVLRLLPR